MPRMRAAAPRGGLVSEASQDGGGHAGPRGLQCAGSGPAPRRRPPAALSPAPPASARRNPHLAAVSPGRGDGGAGALRPARGPAAGR